MRGLCVYMTTFNPTVADYVHRVLELSWHATTVIPKLSNCFDHNHQCQFVDPGASLQCIPSIHLSTPEASLYLWDIGNNNKNLGDTLATPLFMNYPFEKHDTKSRRVHRSAIDRSNKTSKLSYHCRCRSPGLQMPSDPGCHHAPPLVHIIQRPKVNVSDK